MTASGSRTPRLSGSGRGALTLIGGTAIGQLIALCLAPALSRLYTPRDFGAFTILSVMVATLGVVSTLRLDLAVPLPADEETAHSLIGLGVLSALGFTVLGTMAVAFGGEWIASAFSEPRLLPWLWLVPISGSVMGVYLLLNQLAIRHRRYGSIARRNVLQSSAMMTVQVLAGVAGLKRGGLVVGLAVGYLVGALTLSSGAGLFSTEARRGRQRAAMRLTFARYRRFPILLAPAGLLNVLGQQLPLLLVALWFGTQEAGWLGLTQRVLALPVALIGIALSQVYLAEVSRAARSDLLQAMRLFQRSTKLLTIVATVLLAVLLAFGPALFALVFGNEWRQSGEFARALALALAGQMVGAPLSQTLIVLEKQRLQLWWDAGRVLATTAAVGVAAALGAPALLAVWLLSATWAILSALSWWLCYRALRERLAVDPGRDKSDAASRETP